MYNPYQRLLSSYQIVALDFDHTLVNGPKSHLLQQWVDSNPDVEKWIITFRNTPNWVGEIPDELAAVGLNISQFAGVVHLPAGVWEEYSKYAKIQHLINSPNKVKYQRALEYHGVSDDEVRASVSGLTHWKAEQCVNLGAPVLVDDAIKLTEPGCIHNGIKLVDSVNLKIIC